MFHLLATSGPSQGTRYDLVDGEYVLGRDPSECQIVIKDVPAVSRTLCSCSNATTERPLDHSLISR